VLLLFAVVAVAVVVVVVVAAVVAVVAVHCWYATDFPSNSNNTKSKTLLYSGRRRRFFPPRVCIEASTVGDG
jgi:hypothetical protein